MSEILDHLFGDPAVTDCLSDARRLQAMLDVEAALGRTLAAAGVIPKRAAAVIEQAARMELYDAGQIGREAASAGNLAIPLAAALTERVRALDADAARFVHMGATSQDVIDTGLVLQLRSAVPIIIQSIHRAADAAANHARRYARSPMAGRTWLQHATPITYGLKAAGWCDALDRARARVTESLQSALVVQFGGASGTLASLGPRALAVHDALAMELGLAAPAIPWHSHRGRLADLGAALGIAVGELGKVARDLVLLAQTEVAEAAEALTGGSSSMPQKRNPVGASVGLAAAARAPGLVATLLGAMTHEHERGVGGWQAEWETIPELIRLAGGAARAVADALESLVIDSDRMRSNLAAGDGAIFAEAVATALAERIGRPAAHALIRAAAMDAAHHGHSFKAVLLADATVMTHLSRADIDAAFDPDGQLGASQEFIERVLAGRRTAGA